MIILYVNLVKISEMSAYTSVSDFRDHPLLGVPNATFTLDGRFTHSDFNMAGLFRALRHYKPWEELDLEFSKNPLKVYTKLVRGLPNPWQHVPYGSQVWLNGHLVLGHVKDGVVLDSSEIINKCRRSAKFDPTATNKLTFYQGNQLKFSIVTYDITEDCSIMTGCTMYESGSHVHTWDTCGDTLQDTV